MKNPKKFKNPKKVTSPKVCPNCGGRATKIEYPHVGEWGNCHEEELLDRETLEERAKEYGFKKG